jgi:betaine-aldehyde dehydrogenase
MTIETELKMLSGKLWLDGALADQSGDTIPVIDPASEAVIGMIVETPLAVADDVVARSHAVQRAWARLSAQNRADALHTVAACLRAHAVEIGQIMTLEMGKPFPEAAYEATTAATAFSFYAELAKADAGRIAGSSQVAEIHMTLKQPLGTVVCATPFNYPLLLMAWQVAAALAAGNAVIVKPSDLTSLTTLAAMRAFNHLPPSLVQVVTGTGKLGAYLVGHEGTHGVAFTGSVDNGRAVARSCADRFKPALIEASGNDPFIVMPSAPLDVAIRAAAFAAFFNCGQVCTSAERFLVHEDIHDTFVAGLAEEARKLRVGSGLTPVDMGPMAAQRERDRYEPIVAQAMRDGARVMAGGGRPTHLDKGWFVEPTVLADVTPDMRIMNTEPFGPVAPVCRVKDFDEAIELANASEFGLGANIFTHDLGEAMRAVEEIESGIVWVNSPLNDNDAVPFGGRKLSGCGRELGREGLDQFRQSKMVMIAPQARHRGEFFPYPDKYWSDPSEENAA